MRKLLGEQDSDSSGVSDSDDDDWIPANIARRQALNQKDNSGHDESEDSEDIGEIAEGNAAVEEEVENNESEDDDNETETPEPEGNKIFVVNND